MITKTTGKNAETVAEYRQGSRYGLAELVKELERQRTSRLDFVSDSRNFKFEHVANDDGASLLKIMPATPQAGEWLDRGGLTVSASALAQVCETPETNVPTTFARKLLVSQPDLAAKLLTDLWTREPASRLVRCLDGKVRAVLSDKYRVLDNFDLALSALDVAKAAGAEPIECNMTDRNMRLKLVCKSLWDTIEQTQRGPSTSWYAGGLGSQEYLGKVAARTHGNLPGGPGTVWPCATISNSETGHGGLNVRIGLLAGICFNLATVETVVSRVHLGGRLDSGVYSLETQNADSKAIMLAIRDNIKAAFDPAHFAKMVAASKAAACDIVKAPTEAVGLIVEANNLNDEAKDRILEQLPTRLRYDPLLGSPKRSHGPRRITIRRTMPTS